MKNEKELKINLIRKIQRIYFLNKLKNRNFIEENKKYSINIVKKQMQDSDNNLFLLQNNIDRLEMLSFSMSKSKERKIVNQIQFIMTKYMLLFLLNPKKTESLSIEQFKNISNNIIDPLIGIVKLKDIFPTEK